MAFGARKAAQGRKAKTRANLRLKGNKGKVPVTSAIISDVLCMLTTLITGNCVLL